MIAGRHAHQLAAAPAAQLLAELQHADRIIKTMLAAMSTPQKLRVSEQLETAGIATDGMTRHHERAAVIEAATAVASVMASSQAASPRAPAVDVGQDVQHVAILLRALVDEIGRAAGGPLTARAAAVVQCFAVSALRIASSTAVVLGQEGGAA